MNAARTALIAVAAAIAAIAWVAPLSALLPGAFSAHMTTHMMIVAVVAPLVALAVARTPLDPAMHFPSLFAPVPASIAELIVVWAFHTPLLHSFARSSPLGFLVEQSLFLGCGVLLWCSSIGADASRGGARAGSGVLALLLTSMHMTLLGALLALAPRPLFTHGAHHQGHHAHDIDSVSALGDQHVGGAIMLIAGAVVYLAGGLALAALILRRGKLRRLADGSAAEITRGVR